MKLLPLLSSLALFSSFTLASARPRPRNVVDLAQPDLVKRTPGFDDGGYSHGGKGGSEVDVSVDVNVKQGRPSYDYEPDDSGYGYGVDYRGYGPPSWCGKGWQWFGRDIGWAPYKGWRPEPHWEPPTIFVRVWVKVSWWSPPKPWCDYWSSRYHHDWYRYGVPSHWGGWKPRGYGHGGGWKHEEDHNGYFWWNKKDGDYRDDYDGGGHYKRDE
ncbi:hypothetical protein JCM8547_003543 [Rhodosporidiobolus lusitaniae]